MVVSRGVVLDGALSRGILYAAYHEGLLPGDDRVGDGFPRSQLARPPRDGRRRVTWYAENRYSDTLVGMAQPRITSAVLAAFAVLLEAVADGMSLYGLEIAAAAGISHTTIYDVLARLEEAGWLTSHWEELGSYDEPRPRRRLYRLTPLGENIARREVNAQFETLDRARKLTRQRARASPGLGVT